MVCLIVILAVVTTVVVVFSGDRHHDVYVARSTETETGGLSVMVRIRYVEFYKIEQASTVCVFLIRYMLQ